VVIDTLGTGRVPDEEIERVVLKHFDLSPAGIIKALGLRRPIFKKTAAYGHFGRKRTRIHLGADGSIPGLEGGTKIRVRR
jgi:S-adenosylmethionine synthetase